MFATTEDNQSFVAIEIYQGEAELASKNRRLGRFVLGDITPAPRGRTKVEVSFSMDADGILEVSAVEVGTGRAATVTIEASSGLSADEIANLGSRAGYVTVDVPESVPPIWADPALLERAVTNVVAFASGVMSSV